MNQKQPKYLIYNTTRKPPRIVNGKDQRSMSEKVGHGVTFRDKRGAPCIIVAGGQPRMVDELTPGLIALATGPDSCIKIKKIDDVMEALQDHALPQPVATAKPKAFAEGVPPVGPTSSAGKAVEMGADTHAQRGGSEHEGAVNPSGDPNFLVRAPAGPQHSRRAAKKDAAAAQAG